MAKAKSKIKVADLEAIIGTTNDAAEIVALNAMDEDLSVEEEIAKLEGVMLDDVGDRAAMAMSKLADFTLDDSVLQLLEFCVDNVIDSKPERIEDKARRAKAEMHIAILEMADRDLTGAIDLLVQSAPIDGAPGAVYGLCYALQKSSTYRSNLLLRAALDPKESDDADEERNIAPHDYARRTDAPCGLGRDLDELDDTTEGVFNVAGGARKLSRYEQVLSDYSDLYYYLQLLTEAFGWDPDAPMPYTYEVKGDGPSAKFTPVYNAEAALDMQQVAANARKAERAEKSIAANTLLVQRARLMLLHASRRKAA